MSAAHKDAGTIEVLLKRLTNERLPRALELQDKVNRGERLDDADLSFLNAVFHDASGVQQLVAKNPQYQALVTRLISLYSEITRKALENERKA
jgi:hypothetical protein